MLVLMAKEGEEILVITPLGVMKVKLLAAGNVRAKLGFQAGKQFVVLRGKLLDATGNPPVGAPSAPARGLSAQIHDVEGCGLVLKRLADVCMRLLQAARTLLPGHPLRKEADDVLQHGFVEWLLQSASHDRAA